MWLITQIQRVENVKLGMVLSRDRLSAISRVDILLRYSSRLLLLLDIVGKVTQRLIVHQNQHRMIESTRHMVAYRFTCTPLMWRLLLISIGSCCHVV